MSLIEYEGKKVKITDIDGDVFTGKVNDYIYPEDNEPEEEAIIVDGLVGNNGYKYGDPIEFKASEIKSIEVIV